MTEHVEYETVWSGATHRTFQQPVVASSTPRVVATIRKTVHPRERVAAENRAKVRACLGVEWVSPLAIMQSVPVTAMTVRRHLVEAVADGFAEFMERRSATRQNGEALCWYRRKQAS